MAKNFKDLSGQEILALAISSEETDARIYADFAAGLKAKASVLKSKREDMVNAGLFPVARMKQLMIEAGLVVETVIFWSIALPGALLVLAVELLWENLVGFKIAGHLSASH